MIKFAKVVAVAALVGAVLSGGYVAADAASHAPTATAKPATAPVGSVAADYHSLSSPYRILDTRDPSFGGNGHLNVYPGAPVQMETAGDGVPAGATAVVLNVTVANATSAGYLTVVPDDGADPTASSTVNWPAAGALLSNSATVALPADGAVRVYNHQGNTDAVLDVVGYYTAVQAPTFGVGQVWINTKYGETQWAQYETAEAGAPGGDQAGGTFRFTCTLADTGCDLSLKAYSTANGYTVYPRIVLEKEDNTTGAKLTCEYADGADNNGAAQALTSTATVIPLGIGSTADCGGNQVGFTGGPVTSINVPGSAGQGIHYDANVTLTFVRTS